MDAYSEKKKVQMSRETGRDPTVSHHILKNPMTSFAEAKLGKMIDHSARAGFLKYNRQVRAATRPGISSFAETARRGEDGGQERAQGRL